MNSEKIEKMLKAPKAAHEVNRVYCLFLGDNSQGCADVPAKKLRARVFNLEGLGSELALSLQDMLDRFSPNDDGLSDAEIACAERAREVLRSAKVVLVDYYKSELEQEIPICARCCHKASLHVVYGEERGECMEWGCSCEQFERDQACIKK